MNSLEIVRLVRSKSADELTIEEVLLIRDALERTPELYHLLGGEEELEQYLADAPDVSELSAREKASARTSEIGQEATTGIFRRAPWLTAFLLALLLALGWFFFGRHTSKEKEGSVTRLPQPNSKEQSAPITSQPETEKKEEEEASAIQPEEQSLPPLSDPYPLFEDEGRFVEVDQPAANGEFLADLIANDRHSGQRSVRVAPKNRFRLELGRTLSIRGNPEAGEFRYLRFAFRKFGSGRLCLELDREESAEPSIRYDAGQGSPSHGSALRVWGLELPSEWIVMTRDLFEDFGPGEINSLSLSVLDGQHALFDHIYLSRTETGLEGIVNAPSVEQTNERARRVLARKPISVAGPAVVGLESNGHRGTGVLIGKDGYILTCAHHFFQMEGEINVRLADGRQLKGRKSGIDRNADSGLIELVDDSGPQGLEISTNENHTPQDLFVGFAVTPRFNDGRVQSYIAEVEPEVDKKILWTNFVMEGAELGGPLVDRDGRVVGVHVQTSADGKMGFARLTVVRRNWKRIASGDTLGKWLPGTGPMIGVVTTAIAEGSRVDRVVPDSPAAKAGLQAGDLIIKVNGQEVRSYLDIGRQLAGYNPGDLVPFLTTRDGVEHAREISLMPRQNFSAP